MKKNQSPALDKVTGQYLARKGLSFDFDAGDEPYDYQLAIGSGVNDTLVGGDARDYLWGLGGDDALAGGMENDNLFGDSGNDTIVGAVGMDHLVGGKGDDRLYGGDESDGLMGGDGNDFLDEGAGHGDLDGAGGDDTLIGGLGADAFVVSPMSGNDVIRDFTAGPGMFDHLALMDLRWADLRFEDSAAGVKISWATGSVVLEGVRQTDLAQDDFMFADSPDLPPGARPPSAPSSERPTPSTDGPALAAEAMPGKAFDNFADARIKKGESFGFTFQGDETYRVEVGSMESDTIVGSDAWDQLFGRNGDDRLRGMAGDDILQGDAGMDTLAGGAGMDRLDGGMDADHLEGGDNEDELMGMEGGDVLDGGAGHDMLEGGMGNDTLTGGSGADAFIVGPDSGHDIVLDFEATGAAQGAFDHIAFMEILPDQVSVTDTATGALVSWDTNADGTAEGTVLLQNVYMADLRQSDFMFNEEPGFVAGINAFGSYYLFG